MQHEYLKLMILPSKSNESNNCMTQMLTEIYSYIYSLCLLQNSYVHNTDLNQVTSYQRIQLLHEIESMYNQQPHMLCSDRDLFSLSILH